MADDSDADVVEVVVVEVGQIWQRTADRVTKIAARLPVEECPPTLGGVIDRILVAVDEAVERRVERKQRAFVRRDGAQQVGTIWCVAEDLLKGAAIIRYA